MGRGEGGKQIEGRDSETGQEVTGERSKSHLINVWRHGLTAWGHRA